MASLLLGGLPLLTTGCATLFHGSRGVARMRSTPPGAEVWIDGSYVGRTPLAYQLATNDEHVVFFRAPGYVERTFRVRSSVGAGWVVLDVLALVFPLIVDAATGAWLYLQPIDAVLEPSAVPAAVPSAPGPAAAEEASPPPDVVPPGAGPAAQPPAQPVAPAE